MMLIITFSVIIFAKADYSCPGGQLTSQHRKDIVDQHNEFRSQLIHGKFKNKNGKFMPKGKNMLKLKWSCELENSSQILVDKCKHRYSSNLQGTGIGENIYALWSLEKAESYRDTAGIVAGQAWWLELRSDYLDNPSNILTRDVTDRSFTQMAWGKTEKIGCGIATHCDRGRKLMVICHYSPGGNVINEWIYELGEPCKNDDDCSTKKCEKKSGLCEIHSA